MRQPISRSSDEAKATIPPPSSPRSIPRPFIYLIHAAFMAENAVRSATVENLTYLQQYGCSACGRGIGPTMPYEHLTTYGRCGFIVLDAKKAKAHYFHPCRQADDWRELDMLYPIYENQGSDHGDTPPSSIGSGSAGGPPSIHPPHGTRDDPQQSMPCCLDRCPTSLFC